jgi:predicted transcriptional regulator
MVMSLRLPPELGEALRELAEREDRSLSNLIVHLLRRAVEGAGA